MGGRGVLVRVGFVRFGLIGDDVVFVVDLFSNWEDGGQRGCWR